MRNLLMVSTAAALSAAGAMSAQNTPAKPDSTCTKYSDGRVECRSYRRVFTDSAFVNGAGIGNGKAIFMRMDSAMAKRAALGIELRATGTRRDTLGVFVDAVTPKGPAETAGIVEGDRIAAINGVDLRTPVADIDDAYSNGMASHRLTREVRKLTPGSRVTLRVFSNGRFKDVQIVAGKATDQMRFGGRFNIDGPGRPMTMPFGEPGGVMLAPEMKMLRRDMVPLMRDRVKHDIDDIDDEFPDEAIPPVTADEIRELVAAAIRDVAPALRQLAADGVA
jgi:hypothetical protein